MSPSCGWTTTPLLALIGFLLSLKTDHLQSTCLDRSPSSAAKRKVSMKPANASIVKFGNGKIATRKWGATRVGVISRGQVST